MHTQTFQVGQINERSSLTMLYIYVFCIFLLILSGVYSWPTLFVSDHVMIFIHFIALLSGSNFAGKIKKVSKGLYFYLFVILVGTVLLAKGLNGTIIKAVLFALLILQIFSFEKASVERILKLLNTTFFFIIAVSTVLYIINGIGISMPSFGVIKYFQYLLDNHLFFVTNLNQSTVRFYGFCVEPGYFALLLSCLICANEYRINKYNIVYLISLLLTLSLGGLLITALGWFLHFILSKGGSVTSIIKRSIAFILIAIVLVVFLSKMGALGDVFSDSIIGRLQYDPDKGFVGNNRMNERFDAFWYSFLLSDQLLWGMGSAEYFSSIDGLDLDGASYRVFVMQYGVLYTFLFVTSVLYLYRSLGNKKELLPIVTLYLLDFLQHGTPFQGVFFIVYLLMRRYQNGSTHTTKEVKDSTLLLMN